MLKSQKIWRLKTKKNEHIQQLTKVLQLSPIISQILVNRDIYSVEEADSFLHGNLTHLEDPYQLPNMEKAVERIILALGKGEGILIYGDYDVDGISSTALLSCFLKQQGAIVHCYLPERLEEGYGLNKDVLRWAKEDLACNLVITVDCGINATLEVNEANSFGLDVVITDHHEPGLEMPPAIAIVNPKLQRDSCFQHLAGVGVAFKLAQALAIKLNLPQINNTYAGDLLDFAVLGTIADVVPLVGENRILVKYGLAVLNELKRPGIKALVEVAGLGGKKLSPGHIAFGLAPRINAVGRLGSASPALELLLTDSDQTACELAAKLSRENTERQFVESQIFNEVCQRIESEVDLACEKVIVMASEKWHSGVIGIVASKIVERYYRPTILLAIEGEFAKGSGRSIKHFDLFKALQNCEATLVKYGGHPYAAGLTVETDNIDELKQLLNNYASQLLSPSILIPSQEIDMEISLDDINSKFFNDLTKLEPFGAGNPEPSFYSQEIGICEYREVGKQLNHLKCKVGNEHQLLDAIGFNLASQYKEKKIQSAKEVGIIYNIQENDWNGEKTLQLNLKDIHCRPPFMEFFQLSIDYASFWENAANKKATIVKVPLRRIGSGLSFMLAEVLAFKEIELLRLDGQLNVKEICLAGDKATIATDAFFLKNQININKDKSKVIEFHQLFQGFNCCEDVYDKRGSEKASVLDQLILKGKKLYIVCNYREKAIILAEQLKCKYSHLNEHSIQLVFNSQELQSLVLNHQELEIVISNQLLELYTWFEYDIKVIYDAPFSSEELRLRTLKNNSEQVMLLWNKEDLSDNAEMLQAMFPSKDFLKTLVTYLEKCPKNELIILENLLNALASFRIRNLDISIIAGLKACEELGIVKKEKGNYYPGLMLKTINFEESACFQEGVQEKEAFSQLLISTPSWKIKTEVI